MPPLDAFISRTRIAYLSMEIAFDPAIPTYAGGLGVLAGDTVRAAADLALPMVFVTLASREGYLRQEVSPHGDQVDRLDPWDPADHLQHLDAGVAVSIEGRPVWIQAWLRLHKSSNGGCVPVILLDTKLPLNDERDRGITDRLYGGDLTLRLRQEAVLGIGGERILRALGFEIATYHLNEGHAALLPLTILRRHRLPDDHPPGGRLRYDDDPVRARCVFTTHTPLEAGSDRFPYDLVARVLGDFFELDQLRLLAGDDALNMTRLALSLSSRVNAVAIRHAETTQRMFPDYHILAVTNGVHPATWVHPALAKLLDDVAPGWTHNPDLLIRADRLSDEAVQAAHAEAKAALIAETQRRCGIALRPELPIIGFARRMTGYKRPDLLFTDLARLRAIAARQPFQVVMAGKAHPADGHGKGIIRQLHEYARELNTDLTVAFVPGYDMHVAKTIVTGVDVWLNNPIPPLEASGTSGMKAALNGVPNFSVLDGWWVEGCEEGVTGWSIGDDLPSDHARDLYDKLESTILPLWHSDRQRWAGIMKNCIARIGSRFNSINMMRRYAAEIYLR